MWIDTENWVSVISLLAISAMLFLLFAGFYTFLSYVTVLVQYNCSCRILSILI